MADKQGDKITVISWVTDKNAIRRSEHTITSMKIKSSGRGIISELMRERALRLPNVEKLCFYKGYFNDTITQLITGLPKLKVLEFDQTTVQNPKCIEQFLPTLEHLTVHNHLCLENGRLFTVENVRRAITLNPQLKGIRIRCDAFHPVPDQRNAPAVIQMLRFMSKNLPHLQNLEIFFSVDYYNDLNEPIVFKSVTKSTLFVEEYNFKWGPTSINIPIAFVHLRELEINAIDMYTDDYVDFVVKNRLLEKLKFHFHWIGESDDDENCVVYDILYEDDVDNEKENNHRVAEQGTCSKREDSEGSEDDDDCDDDDERIIYDCPLDAFLKLPESLSNLKELSIGPITRCTGQDIVKMLSTGKSLEKLHVKLRYPLYHRPGTRYSGVTAIDQRLRFVKEKEALAGRDWSCKVEYNFKPGSESEFRVAHLIFQRNSHQ